MDARGVGLGILDTIVKGFLVIVCIMMISKYASVAYDYGYHIYNQTPASQYDTRTVTISITDSMSVTEIAELLENRGLVKDKNLFWLQERFSEYHGMIAPGTYDLSPSMTPDEIIGIMCAASIEADKEAAE
ncbi:MULTISPECIES: endolytic transglycosylase MltG [unclassified Butyrivibrio]|uniref:endolytic transglycosylase MltG n=1 Tax=unclassified Butyrivibrio TaxID=2639466 RepID=UPI000424C851|nr:MULTISPECIES: endolytic transglycosylase MltG [unclassified Butyrivibrio]